MGKKTSRNDEEYMRRRQRNNEAVKKSRVKSKLRSQATQDRVQQLQLQNTQLEEKMKNLSSEVEFYKDLLCNTQGIEGADNDKLHMVLKELDDVNGLTEDEHPTPNTTSAGSQTLQISSTRRSSRKSSDHKF